MSLHTIKVPSLEQLGEVAVELGLALPEAELAAHHQSLLGAFEAYSRLDRMPDELPPVNYPRLPGRRPRSRRTGMAPGTSRPKSRAPRPVSSGARPWPSRTISVWPACR